MGASYGKQKNAKNGKLDVGRFTALPHSVIHSQQYRQLGYAARSLLFDMAAQYNQGNNGKLVCCTKYLKPLGWTSNDTITRALRELLKSSLLIQTRQGMRPPCSQAAWFSMGWLGLDVMSGLDIKPSQYRKCELTAIEKIPLPINGALSKKSTPTIGIAALVTTPIIGAVEAKKDITPIPIGGEYIDLPSNYSVINQHYAS